LENLNDCAHEFYLDMAVQTLSKQFQLQIISS